jgi:hypothetical protein
MCWNLNCVYASRDYNGAPDVPLCWEGDFLKIIETIIRVKAAYDIFPYERRTTRCLKNKKLQL